MLRTLLISTLLAGSMTVQAQITERPHRAADAISLSRGHNLKALTDKSLRMRVKGLETVSASSINTPTAKRRIDVNSMKKSPIYADGQPTTSLLSESFESCELLSDKLPQGWTSKTNITEKDATHHWHGISKAYATQWYFPQPADGDMMMVMFYDSYYKDEMLISPNLNVPESGGYELTYYWFTTPVWLYVIDRDHVDFDNQTFIKREKSFDFEVCVKSGDGEWQKLYSLEEQYSQMDYAELSDLELPGLVRTAISLDPYAGQEIQLGFRYYGIDGDALFLDGISVDLPAPEAHYTPSLSRLYFGISPDEYMGWLPASIEFSPVNYPTYWYNDSENDGDVTYSWTYYDVNGQNEVVGLPYDDPEVLKVTYRPDYFSGGTLMNNLYYLPQLHAQGANGAVGTYTSKSNYLQAGGTTEFDYADGSKDSYTRFTALPFDVLTEGLGVHAEECEELGLFAEPIFGYSVNHDIWWEHYSYPDGNPDGKYSYVDGFANLVIPHEEAPMVVYGVSAMAMGTIYPEAEFKCTVYRVDDEGQIVETPVVQATLMGDDVLAVSSGMTRDFLIMNFEFDSPVIFSAADTGLGYMVEISGYHDENIEYFAPLQSVVPNEYEWCLGYYRHHWPYDESITEEMGSVAFFTNDYGQYLYTTFAIGLDAHYPWLQVDGESSVTIDGTDAMARLKGYYPADRYTVDAPEWLDVTFAGRYVTDVTFTVLESSDTDRHATVTVTAPGVSCAFDVTAKASTGIIDIANDGVSTGDVYNMQGIRVGTDLNALPAGIYIQGGKKITVTKE